MVAFSRILRLKLGVQSLHAAGILPRTSPTGSSIGRLVPHLSPFPVAPNTVRLISDVSSAVSLTGNALPGGSTAQTVKSEKVSAVAAGTEEFPYPIKRVTIRTCDQLYQQQAFEGGKRDLPLDGIELDIGYIDTGYPENVTGVARMHFPIVLCLHGAAGTHKDLAGVITTLAAKGARVIAPNFPGYSITPMDKGMHFKHTTIENSYFILDFLHALGIRSLDMVAAFSCGCYAAVPLAAQSGMPVRSMALFQVPGHRPYKALKPFWVLKNVVSVMRYSWIRRILNPISYHIMKATGWNHIPNIDTPYIMGLVTTGVPFDGYRRASSELPFHRIPLLITFSEDDRFMDADISYEYADLVGLAKDRLTYIHAKGHVEKEGTPILEDTYLKGLVFRKGGHYAQRREPTASVMKNAAADLYDYVMRTRKTGLWTMAYLNPSTILCRYFAAGKCSRKDCFYSHDPQTSQPGNICRYFQLGICFYENDCRFQHIPSEAPAAESVVQPPVGPVKIVMTKAPAPAPVSRRPTTRSQTALTSPLKPTAAEGTAVMKATKSAPEVQPQPQRPQKRSKKRVRGVDTEAGASAATGNPAAVKPKVVTLPPLCPIARTRTCSLIDCPFRHGAYCDICQCLAIDPKDPRQRKEHRKACLIKFEADMESAFAVQLSAEKQCNVCLDIVMKQVDKTKRRFGVLQGCQHAFCFSCIMLWRKQPAEGVEVLKRNRTCPTCRVHSHFVFPAKVWPETKEAKDSFMAEVKEAIAKKPCKSYNQGKGKCNFGNQCWYLHAKEDGTVVQLPAPIRRNRRTARTAGFFAGGLDDFMMLDSPDMSDDDSDLQMDEDNELYMDMVEYADQLAAGGLNDIFGLGSAHNGNW
ncbi:putative E3 ubiquitin-protein ligase makorin-2 [Hypsibius exemplaris]|uniref:RING-type E3 ubiquitin transferase n=1 Tax=Hypsibius exemplaris TaxID=2072580 RepID=A0A9X6NE26_HYPEX|nr:putative E3 ubiquitin-protein ligase makorin-2 [Hypsibius exemplaris]